MRRYSPYLGLAAGLIVGILLAAIAVFVSGAGHGSYFPMRVFFPFTMFSAFLFGSLTAPFVVIALVQFPLYGFLLGRSYRFDSFRVWLVGVFLAHLLAVTFTFVFHSEDFPNRWPNKSPEPTAVGAFSSAVAVHAASRRWLSFFR